MKRTYLTRNYKNSKTTETTDVKAKIPAKKPANNIEKPNVTTEPAVKIKKSKKNVETDESVASTSTTQSSTIPGMRVLSLFDGIGTGFYALSKLGFNVEDYYACEIDNDALLLTKSHFGNRLKQLGSVTVFDQNTLNEIGPIDILIGGSPCSDLSCVNFRKKGLFNANGTGILFFDYYRIWSSLLRENRKQNRPFFWFFENVANMEINNRNIISKFLDSQPFVIDSLYLSPQRRKRFFWSNIPGIKNLSNISNSNTNYGPILDEVLDVNLGRTANIDKINTITTKKTCLQDGISKNPVLDFNGENSSLYITEMEKIFGFEPHFTDVGNFSITKRQKLLGKAWSVQVIKQIFQCLSDKFNKIE